MPDTAKKTNINIKRIMIRCIAQADESDPDNNEENECYGPWVDLTGRARSFTDTPAVNKAELYGDGELQETVYSTGTGSLTLALNYLTDADRKYLFGENYNHATQDEFYSNANPVKGNETPCPCTVSFMTECTPDGSVVNLYKYFAVTFQPNEENVAQIEGNSINYSTVQITGTYREHRGLGYVKAIARHVNANTQAGQALIDQWFESANFDDLSSNN